MQLDELRTLLCSQANHARTSQNIVSCRERAAATDVCVSRMVAVAHTTMNVGMDNTTKTISQPLVRNRSNTILSEVVGKVGILSKPSARKQTVPAQGNRNRCWTFHIGHSEEDYIGHLPNPVTQLRLNTNKSLITLSLLI